MTLCRNCKDDKLSHHGGIGKCVAYTPILGLQCECLKFEPIDLFEPCDPQPDRTHVDEAYDQRIELLRGGEA